MIHVIQAPWELPPAYLIFLTLRKFECDVCNMICFCRPLLLPPLSLSLSPNISLFLPVRTFTNPPSRSGAREGCSSTTPSSPGEAPSRSSLVHSQLEVYSTASVILCAKGPESDSRTVWSRSYYSGTVACHICFGMVPGRRCQGSLSGGL